MTHVNFIPMHLQQFIKHIEKSFERSGSKNISFYLGEPDESALAQFRKQGKNSFRASRELPFVESNFRNLYKNYFLKGK